MRRTLLGLLAAVLVASGSTLVASPAQAASKPVTIKKLSTQWIDWNGSAVVKPNVKKAKKVKVVKKAMTVRQGGKVVRRNRSAVRLRPGTYRLTTKITYTFKGKKSAVTRQQQLVVKQGRCATRADVRGLVSDPTFVPEVVGDTVATVSAKLHSRGSGQKYTTDEMRTVLEAMKILLRGQKIPGLIAELDKMLAEIDALEARGVTTLEDRMYRGCSKNMEVSTSFANGELMRAGSDEGFFLGMQSALSAQPLAAAAAAALLD